MLSFPCSEGREPRAGRPDQRESVVTHPSLAHSGETRPPAAKHPSFSHRFVKSSSGLALSSALSASRHASSQGAAALELPASRAREVRAADDAIGGALALAVADAPAAPEAAADATGAGPGAAGTLDSEREGDATDGADRLVSELREHAATSSVEPRREARRLPNIEILEREPALLTVWRSRVGSNDVGVPGVWRIVVL